jgi:hypothetical protein
VSTTATYSNLANTCARLGVALPAPLAAAKAAADTFLAALPPRDASPLAAALAAVARGDDPLDDAEVARQIVAQKLADMNLNYAARLRCDAQLSDAIREHADLLLAAWATHLQPHADAMAEAARLGVTDLTQPGHLRGRQLQAWGQAASAAEQFDIVQVGTNVLFMETRVGKPDQLLVLAAATGPQLQAARDTIARNPKTSAAWAIASSGVAVQHITAMADLQARKLDGTVETLTENDNDQHDTKRRAASFAN